MSAKWILQHVLAGHTQGQAAMPRPARDGPLVTAAGIVALLALAVTVASLAWLRLQPTGLSAMRNAVSQYGISSFRAGYRVATIAFGAAGLALAAGIGQALGGRGLAVVILLVVFARRPGGDQLVPDGRAGRELDAHRAGAFRAGLRRIRDP